MNTCYSLLLLVILLNDTCSARIRTKHGRSCFKCPRGWGVTKNCTLRGDTECERCTPGVTYSSEYSETSPCWQCSRCGVGLYEARKCTISTDTLCDDCMRFIYSPAIKKNNDFRNSCSYLFLNY